MKSALIFLAALTLTGCFGEVSPIDSDAMGGAGGEGGSEPYKCEPPKTEKQTASKFCLCVEVHSVEECEDRS